ncbi:hypothetical protein CERSUDRAFT_126817 [Gelatoporia subvermispora B]|uniref:WDR59/RTC1-like RING zinc finger domain-containing protein n=1 Tax=Ceriporiopsis subvermispora (strain B) TaxID=914234 RepID=M2R2D8_CERS8|nr:hypothetical protein CERSUDRAFT_126817 [Gelatoporia subvermispora B]
MSSRKKSMDMQEPHSPDQGSNLRRSLQIDMKALVGDAVGNMSISPGSRDVVLAARKGLFIIDLEAPLNVPRFLPQGGTWDVADVQWNPHQARGEYIVSTSGEKLLIWNLLLAGKTSIQHVLKSHYRAITDINWHTTDPDVVVSTGIDSWLWAWDLRTPEKPIMGLCDFNSAGTQVKWNRLDGNILASSHLDTVLIWDRRKGSLPLSRIPAHSAKIYGIDWSHDRRNEIVTCSLDKTIKIWDTQTSEAKVTIDTTYPVWRARDLPFGQGVLSLPQRGETTLEMWAHDDPESPIETFAGHTDVVKEFVWRRGGPEGLDFQLITWSKDKTLRFWPVSPEIMQKAGAAPKARAEATDADHRSFSHPPIGMDPPPAVSAPVGNRAILAEVRAPFPMRPPRTSASLLAQLHGGKRDSSSGRSVPQSPLGSNPIPITQRKGGTMTRGLGGGRSAQITAYAWLSSVKVGGKRESSSNRGSVGESGTLSRRASRSRAPSAASGPLSQVASALDMTIDSRATSSDGIAAEDISESLQDEITSAVNKLATSKVKLEKAELTRRRTCTFGLHGPWGESTSVFIRITFAFPRDYPHAGEVPTVDLERNPLISMKTHASILRHLRKIIHQQQGPCLERCLRFLLFGDEDSQAGRHISMESSSEEDDDDMPVVSKPKERAFPALRSDKNLAEPRTSQGVFGPTGELVCFSRAPPRIIRNLMREISVAPPANPAEPSAHLFRAPMLLSDAVRHLAAAAHDRVDEMAAARAADEPSSILRIATHLFVFAQQKPRRPSEHAAPVQSAAASYALLPTATARSTVFVRDVAAVAGVDVVVAAKYALCGHDRTKICKDNAEVAEQNGRFDHKRVFDMLSVTFARSCVGGDSLMCRDREESVMHVLIKLYREFLMEKDVQMLAIIATFLLPYTRLSRASKICNHGLTPPPKTLLSRKSGSDYFDFSRIRNGRQSSHSQSPRRPPTTPISPSLPMPPALPSPSSSRGSFSSIFASYTMKQFVIGSRSGYRRSSPLRPEPLTKSWSGNYTSLDSSPTLSSPGHERRPTFSQVVSSRPSRDANKKITFHPVKEEREESAIQTLQLYSQLVCHILAYAEMLLAWQLPHRRSELLKLVEEDLAAAGLTAVVLDSALDSGPIGCRLVPSSRTPSPPGKSQTQTRCSICRLRVTGLSYTCMLCLHISHVACWEKWVNASCASGCGCSCSQSPVHGVYR